MLLFFYESLEIFGDFGIFSQPAIHRDIQSLESPVRLQLGSVFSVLRGSQYQTRPCSPMDPPTTIMPNTRSASPIRSRGTVASQKPPTIKPTPTTRIPIGIQICRLFASRHLSRSKSSSLFLSAISSRSISSIDSYPALARLPPQTPQTISSSGEMLLQAGHIFKDEFQFEWIFVIRIADTGSRLDRKEDSFGGTAKKER